MIIYGKILKYWNLVILTKTFSVIFKLIVPIIPIHLNKMVGYQNK